MKKKVYFVQVNVTYSDFIAYLPYAAGCLAAYAFSNCEIKKKYELAGILYMRKKLEDSLSQIGDPSVVCFTCYVWNMEYNKRLARLVKEQYPDCTVIFGGHNIPFNASLLEKAPYIDILMHGEGEHNLVKLLKALDAGDLSEMTDISFRKNGTPVMLQRTSGNQPLDDLPSPYLEGYFDEMLKEYPSVNFQATLETNRGCPYRCAFCDWCFTEKIRYFPMEKIKKELDWMSEHRITYCYGADSNFGISERDVEIAKYVVDCNKRNGFPPIFKPCYAKNSNDRVFEIGWILNKNGVDKGVTLAYQSVCPEVLENIGRRNLDIAYYTDLNARYTEAGIPTYTELILGLPGETYETFCSGLCRLLEAGQHNSMTVYTCQVYCNAPIAQPAFKKKYGIRWETAPLHGIHYPPNFNGVQEYYDIIVETKDMSKPDWVKANMFSVCVQSFHHLGLLRCFAVYSRYELGISYYDFYNRLLNWIFSDETRYMFSLFEMIRKKTDDLEHSDWCYQNDVFSKVGWYFEEGIFLDLAYNADTFWREIRVFVSELGIDADIFEDLFFYQKSIIRLPGQRELEIKCRYDFYRYFEDIYEDRYEPLRRVNNTLRIKLEKQIDAWDVYAREIIWYGKRRSATLCTNPREQISCKYEDANEKGETE